MSSCSKKTRTRETTREIFMLQKYEKNLAALSGLQDISRISLARPVYKRLLCTGYTIFSWPPSYAGSVQYTYLLDTQSSNLLDKTQEKKIPKLKTTVKQLSSALLHISHHEYTLVACVVGWVC